MELQKYDQLKVKIQALMKDLSLIADERGELIRTGKISDYDDDSLSNDSTESLSDILKQKAESLDSLFRLAVVGHFCRGKSTLINAMLRRTLLTNDLRPNTATSTIIRYGESERIRVTFSPKSRKLPIEYVAKSSIDLTSALEKFTSDAAVKQEELNHNLQSSEIIERGYLDLMEGNRESLATEIEVVEVWCNSQFLLANRIEIIDTPGLGSVFKQHKLATLSTIPKVDATLFVFQLDPGISNREIAFIKLVKEQVKSIFFVANKADQIDSCEVAEVVDFNRSAIESIVEIPVKNIYPISALNEVRELSGISGFRVFLPALQNFLVENSGANRLSSALLFARGHCEQLIAYVQSDISAQDQTLDALRRERTKIQASSEEIAKKKRDLLTLIPKRVEEITYQALDNLQGLPAILKEKVERKAHKLSLQQLKDADDYLQPEMKEAITSWLKVNQSGFENKMLLLNDRIKREVKSMLGEIQSTQERQLLDRDFEIDLSSPVSTSNIVSVSIGEDLVRLLSSIGITGIVANVVGEIVDVGAQVVKNVRRFIGGIFGKRNNQRPQQDRRLENARRRVCEVMNSEVQSSGKNAYEIVVFGYVNYGGQKVEGIRDVVTTTFDDWGKQLEKRINVLVNSNVNAKLSQLDRQIQDLEEDANETDLIRRIELYRTQSTKLEYIRIQLCELTRHIESSH